jgi:glycosyltransferase involved in cell wall biosynthesis
MTARAAAADPSLRSAPVTAPSDGGAIFVLPTTTVGQLGPVAGWISTGGWAAAAERVLGQAWIVTRHGVLDVEEVRRRAAAAERAVPTGERRVRRAVPTIAKTIAKDLREAQRARRFHVDPQGPWRAAGVDLAFVWQRHELFHRAGLDLAAALHVPSVLFVPALTVWQAEQWSVRRPGWGRWLERHAERPALHAASLVACGTEVVAEQVARLGVPRERLLVTPTGVDLELFAEPVDRADARAALGLGEELVVGWVGSFRPFHGLDQLVRAAARLSGIRLLLVGDGPERTATEALARELGVPATFTGMVPHEGLARVLGAMDVGVALARPGEAFHYSPLKVAEYLAAGLPVVVPRVASLTERLPGAGAAPAFEPGDDADLAARLRELQGDPARRAALAAAARAGAAAWSWDKQVERVRSALTGGLAEWSQVRVPP